MLAKGGVLFSGFDIDSTVGMCKNNVWGQMT
jgi:hypothetical protein